MGHNSIPEYVTSFHHHHTCSTNRYAHPREKTTCSRVPQLKDVYIYKYPIYFMILSGIIWCPFPLHFNRSHSTLIRLKHRPSQAAVPNVRRVGQQALVELAVPSVESEEAVVAIPLTLVNRHWTRRRGFSLPLGNWSLPSNNRHRSVSVLCMCMPAPIFNYVVLNLQNDPSYSVLPRVTNLNDPVSWV